jgi:hypothetical protein
MIPFITSTGSARSQALYSSAGLLRAVASKTGEFWAEQETRGVTFHGHAITQIDRRA